MSNWTLVIKSCDIISLMDNTGNNYQQAPPVSQVTPEGKIVLRAFPTDITLADFAKAVIVEASERLTKAARIASKLNSERPHAPEELRQAGLGWKSNFTTRPLNTLVSKQVGRFPRAIASARYLSSASLPADVVNSLSKTEFFRDEFTKTLRADPRFDDLIETIASENVTFGWCAAGWLDEHTWFPNTWKQDAFYVPVNTKQVSSTANAVLLRQPLLPNEAFVVLSNAQGAEDGRWNLPLLAQAINTAMPENYRCQNQEYSRLREELIRGLQYMSSYTGAKAVIFYHVLAQELNGKVSHYILNSEFATMFAHEDRFPDMSNALTFFAWEKGDGTLMGSKGIGRMAYTMSAVIDRNRNDVVDRLQLSGKLIAKCPPSNHAKTKMSVVGQILLIEDSLELVEQKIEADPSASIELDRFLGGILDEMTGSISQQSFEDRERVTKGEVDARLAQEGERSDDFLQRWLRQVGQLVTGIQYRILNPEMPSDTPGFSESQKLLGRLKTRLSDEEINWLRHTPALTTVAGWTAYERDAIVTACIQAQGIPMYDQHEIAVAKMTAQVGPEFAQQVVIASEDPTQVAEQTRTQLFENDLILNGQESPISPRDAHEIHIQTLNPIIEHAIQEAAQNPTADTIIQAAVAHGMAHVEAAKASGAVSPVIQQAEQQYSQILKDLEKVAKQEQSDASAQQEQAAVASAVTSPAPITPTPNVAQPVA